MFQGRTVQIFFATIVQLASTRKTKSGTLKTGRPERLNIYGGRNTKIGHFCRKMLGLPSVEHVSMALKTYCPTLWTTENF